MNWGIGAIEISLANYSLDSISINHADIQVAMPTTRRDCYFRLRRAKQKFFSR